MAENHGSVLTDIEEYFQQKIIQYNSAWASDSYYPTVENYEHEYTVKNIYDKTLTLKTTDKIIPSLSLSQNASYYISFSVPTSSNLQKIDLILTNDNDNPDNLNIKKQFLSTLTIPRRTKNRTEVPFELIFTPYDEDLQLAWILQRNFSELKNVCPNINNLEIKKLSNMLQTQGANNATYSVTKIGIQGPTGMLFCLNGEQLRIGQNGIYQLEEDIDINFFGVVLKNNSYCIADLKYKKITLKNEGGE